MVSPVFFGRYPRSSLVFRPLHPPSPSRISHLASVDVKQNVLVQHFRVRSQELCESRGGRPGLLSVIVLMVSVDIKQHSTIAFQRPVPKKPVEVYVDDHPDINVMVDWA